RARPTYQPTVSNTLDMDVDPYAGVLGSQVLRQLAQDYAAADGQLTPDLAQKYHLLQFDGKQRVEVSVRATTAARLTGLRASLQGLGMQVMTVAARQNLILGFLDIS